MTIFLSVYNTWNIVFDNNVQYYTKEMKRVNRIEKASVCKNSRDGACTLLT